MINRNNTEFRNQPHEMCVEGAEDDQMTEEDIIKYCADFGYKASEIDIWFDKMQGVWRWVCDIELIKQ